MANLLRLRVPQAFLPKQRLCPTWAAGTSGSPDTRDGYQASTNEEKIKASTSSETISSASSEKKQSLEVAGVAAAAVTNVKMQAAKASNITTELQLLLNCCGSEGHTASDGQPLQHSPCAAFVNQQKIGTESAAAVSTTEPGLPKPAT